VFQKELNYSADRDASVEFLKESYARILSGDSEQTDSSEPEDSNEETFDLADAVPTPAART
jgi:hypothetical protein